MKKYILYILVLITLCGCGSAKQASTASGGAKTAKDVKKKATISADEEGQWWLYAPDKSIVAKVYVERGSTRPDGFHEGLVRIKSDDDLRIGFADEEGRVIIEPAFLAATPFRGEFAAVVPYSESAAVSATDDAAVGVLTGNELWGIIDASGRYRRNPVFKREWNDKVADYVYVSPTNTFWITENGDMKGF